MTQPGTCRAPAALCAAGKMDCYQKGVAACLQRKESKGIDKTRTEAQLVQLGSIAFGVRYILHSQGVKLQGQQRCSCQISAGQFDNLFACDRRDRYGL